MVKLLQSLYAACCCAVILVSTANAATRHAFVVGVDAYDNLGSDKQLAKAVGDARAVAASLRDLGFVVTVTENPRRGEFNRAWQGFLGKVQPSDTVAVFYSGHGVQVGGLNYLMPRDMPKLASGDEGLLRDESIALQRLLDDLKDKQPRLSLVIVDACRDNPFPVPGGRSVGGARGLARVDHVPQGTFVMFSAGAGETALDRLPGNDPSPTSVYTRNLLPLLRSPSVTLQEMAVQVRDDVRRLAATANHTQTPAYWDELTGPRVCLAGPCAGTGTSEPPPPPPPPPPGPPKPLAQTLSDDLTFTIEQATQNRDRVALAMQMKNGKSDHIGIAYDASIRPPDNQFVTYAATLTLSGGQTCYARSVDGLQELDLSTARNFGGQGFSKDRVDRALTALRPGASAAVTLLFADCPARVGETARLAFVLHKLEGEKLGKINVAFPTFSIGK